MILSSCRPETTSSSITPTGRSRFWELMPKQSVRPKRSMQITSEASAAAIGDVVMVPVEGTDSDGNATTTYYIVKRVEGTTGTLAYEDVKEQIDDTLKSYLENNYYTEQLDAWREKADIVIDEDAVNAFDPAA